ncbi:MAG: Ig domain-containing protein, partial [Oscillospiraceae bacterium]|nr:Ig domain-containing protein [Oscillospiraceae bacterium]
MIRPMTHRQQLLLASGCGLLFLLAMLLVWMFMLQKEPEEPKALPAETTAVSSETSTESIYSTETTTQTETSTVETTAATTVLTTVTSTTVTTTTTAATTTTTQTEVIPVESITLTFYEVQLTIGETAMPIVTMHPENASDKSEIWSTSDNNIASISGWGKITAKAEGECIIRVTSAGNPE